MHGYAFNVVNVAIGAAARRMAALGHFQPLSIHPGEGQLSAVKQPLGSRILEGYNFNTHERLLSPIAVIQIAKFRKYRKSANGQ
jgi:hypothetical protein